MKESIAPALRISGIGRQAFNLVKFDVKYWHRIAVLSYQSCDRSESPALFASWTANLAAGTSEHRSSRRPIQPKGFSAFSRIFR